MNVVEKINQILKKANISKVNLAKYLGVSRQMIYNYFDGDDLSKLPKEKCQLIYDLFDVKSSQELIDLKITDEYLEKVNNKMFNNQNNTSNKEEIIELTGLEKEEATLISDISLMLKNIILDNKNNREGEALETLRYLYNFVQNLSTNKELKYILAYFSKNFGYTDPNKYAFNEDNQFILESILFSAMSLYTNGGASRTRLEASHKKWENTLNQKKEEKLSRTQELNTARIRALRELGYTEIDTSNASEVLNKIIEIMSQKI